MESFFSFLEKRVDDCSSLLCIGLDPHVNDLSAPTAASARDFCLNLVKQTSRYAAAFKPNVAFFEVFGAEGWTALKDVIDAIQEESNRMGSMIPVILDAKRGDIASTAEAYAKSAFETSRRALHYAESLSGQRLDRSVHPEFGKRCVPAVQDSPIPGSGDLQDLSGDYRQWSIIHGLSLRTCRQTCPGSGTPRTTSDSSSAQLTWMQCSVSARPRLTVVPCSWRRRAGRRIGICARKQVYAKMAKGC